MPIQQLEVTLDTETATARRALCRALRRTSIPFTPQRLDSAIIAHHYGTATPEQRDLVGKARGLLAAESVA